MKPRHQLRKADRLPFIDPAEALRVHLHGAKVTLAAASKNPPGSIEHALNLAGAQQHALAALRLLSKGTPS